MSKIISNVQMNEDFFLVRAESDLAVKPGQFCMLRGWDEFPLLSRPISIYDAGNGEIAFLYKKVGKGTEILSKMKAGEDLKIQGPYGNGFPTDVKGRIALVGGGVGIAPLFLLAKTLKNGACGIPAADAETVDVFLGFSGEPVLVDEYKEIVDNVTINVGGFVTDDIDTNAYDVIITCGPEIMMRVLYRKLLAQKSEAKLYVSMEKRMGCGFGICKVCTCFTKDGTKTACKDGPVFEAGEVFFDEEVQA